jgi:hypothetical protein
MRRLWISTYGLVSLAGYGDPLNGPAVDLSADSTRGTALQLFDNPGDANCPL